MSADTLHGSLWSGLWEGVAAGGVGGCAGYMVVWTASALPVGVEVDGFVWLALLVGLIPWCVLDAWSRALDRRAVAFVAGLLSFPLCMAGLVGFGQVVALGPLWGEAGVHAFGAVWMNFATQWQGLVVCAASFAGASWVSFGLRRTPGLRVLGYALSGVGVWLAIRWGLPRGFARGWPDGVARLDRILGYALSALGWVIGGVGVGVGSLVYREGEPEA